MINLIAAILFCVSPPATHRDNVILPIHHEEPDRPVKVTYSYKLGRMKETSRFYAEVKYPDGWQEVPIINGYVPKIYVVTQANGDKTITYDYRKKVSYDRIDSANKR